MSLGAARTATARRPRGRRANAAPPRPQPAGAAGRAQAHRAPQPVPWIKRGLAALGVALALVTAVAIARSRMGAGSPAAESPASVPLSVLRTADFHALAFSPENSDTVFFGHHNGVMRSADGGKTWGAVADRRGFDAMGMAVSRANPNQIFIAGHDVFQVSADGGTTWQPVQHNLPGTDIHGFAMSPDDPNRLYAFVNGVGTFASADAGQAWRRLGQTPAEVTTGASRGAHGDDTARGRHDRRHGGGSDGSLARSRRPPGSSRTTTPRWAARWEGERRLRSVRRGSGSQERHRYVRRRSIQTVPATTVERPPPRASLADVGSGVARKTSGRRSGLARLPRKVSVEDPGTPIS